MERYDIIIVPYAATDFKTLAKKKDDGDWVRYEDAAARIAELEAEIVERRKDYSACIRDQDARIAELEAALAAERERERVLIEDLRYALEIVIAYAPNTTDPAWAEDILNKLPAPPKEAPNADA